MSADDIDVSVDELIPLTAGSGANLGSVFRRGDSVLRPTGAHTDAVHALLRHLRDVGFDGAPRVVGLDGSSEVLEYVSGDVPVPPRPPGGGWIVVSEDEMGSVGRLLRRFHEAVRSFVPPPDAVWQGRPPPEYAGSLVCHNDPVVGNVVFRGGRATSLIDFDYAGPSHPIWDLAIAAQHWIPLADPADFLEREGAWSPGQRLLSLCDAYGLKGSAMPRLLDAVDVYLEAGRRGLQRRVEAGEEAFVAYWNAGLGDRLERALRWLRDHRSSLLRDT